MVSHLDAPSADLAKQLVDRALEAERQGLTGTAYVNARGLTQGDTYGRYDESLRRLAGLLREHGTYAVRFEDTERRFNHREKRPMLRSTWDGTSFVHMKTPLRSVPETSVIT